MSLRPFPVICEMLLDRARQRRHPFVYLDLDDVIRALAQVHSTDPDEWVDGFGKVAEHYEAIAREAEEAARLDEAGHAYARAYDAWHLARFPCTNSPPKRRAYDRAKSAHRRALRCWNISVEFCAIPGGGAAPSIPAYLRKPKGVERPPVLVMWGGIDTFKEEIERRADPFLALGIAVLAVDMPGVGDAPVVGGPGAERYFGCVLDWIGARVDLDADRCLAMGLSTGGYWATKIAHVYADRLRGVVNHGGCAHYAFEEAWIARAQSGEYLFELAESLASAFGGSSYDDWICIAPTLSLLADGLLEKGSAPLLCINGTSDTVFPVSDMHLLLEHGSPKSMRLFPGGHMGYTPRTLPVILDWLRQRIE